MNILLAATGSESFSGAAKCLVELAKGLRNNGYKILVLLPDKGDIENLLKSENIDYCVIKQHQAWYVYLDDAHPNRYPRIKQIVNRKAVIAIKKLIRTNHIDIVHENASTAYAAAVAAEECHIPVVWHLREFLEEDLGITFFDQKYSEKIMNRATVAIAISQAVKDKWSQQLNIPIQVIHDGLPVENYFVERNFKPDGRLNILIYGRIVPQKGQLFFFQALAKYVKLYTSEKIHCCWAGMIEDQDYYDSIIALQHEHGMDEYCDYLGEVSDVKKVLQNTDIVAVCSEMEGFGRVTAESMLAGTVVLGADTGATTELIQDGENGFLYKSHDIDSFVIKLHQIVENQENALKAAKLGQIKARQEYSLEHDVKQVGGVYERLVP